MTVVMTQSTVNLYRYFAEVIFWVDFFHEWFLPLNLTPDIYHYLKYYFPICHTQSWAYCAEVRKSASFFLLRRSANLGFLTAPLRSLRFEILDATFNRNF